MSHPVRSKILIPTALLLATALVVLVAGCGQRSTPNPAGTAVPSSDGTLTQVSLDEWRVPVTADSHEYAIAFARAMWTYDASNHNYMDWVNGVSMFADAASSSETVARSMLPGAAEWQQLNVEKARATVADITAETTPELAKLQASHGLPQGWRAYVVRGQQTVTLETRTKTIPRIAAISVVCDYTCKFWSASAQTTR